nr:uncharacterized protein LOC129386958 [Dermacentor andersoni]XP_054931479.1 uncharacterized protein LOC129386958 [Dermacentor andersoni]
MPDTCSTCTKPVDGKCLSCSRCERCYHCGKNCSIISKNAFSKMSTAKHETWTCPSCESSTSNHSDSDDCDASFGHEFSAVNSKLDQLRVTVEALTTKVAELLQFKDTVEEGAETVTEIQKSIEFLSNKYESVKSGLEANQTALTQLHARVESLSETVDAQAELLDKSRCAVNDLEQYSRRCNIEIHGLRTNPNENLVSFMADLAQNLDFSEFEANTIASIRRMPNRDSSTPPILVQMRVVASKEKWLALRTKLRNLRTDESHPQLYFNENLTRTNKELFRLARSKGKENQYKFVWTRNGRVLAKKSEEVKAVIRIEKLSDLNKIC